MDVTILITDYNFHSKSEIIAEDAPWRLRVELAADRTGIDVILLLRTATIDFCALKASVYAISENK